MRKDRLFQIPVTEAKELVAPHKLKDVLTDLVRLGYLSRFEMAEGWVFVWSLRRFDLSVITEAQARTAERPLTVAERRPSSRKRASR
jgi:hypothetical protein